MLQIWVLMVLMYVLNIVKIWVLIWTLRLWEHTCQPVRISIVERIHVSKFQAIEKWYEEYFVDMLPY